jgi:hypothetical protein
MRAPSLFIVCFVTTFSTLPAVGQDQTNKAPDVVQWVNAKTADPKPCGNGWHAVVDAVGNPVNTPSPAAATKALPPTALGPQRGISAVPMDPNPTIILPPSQPEPMDLRYVHFETSFYMIGIYNRWAEQAAKAGKHEEAVGWRTAYQRNVGLNDAEGEVLQEIAHDCNCAVNELDERMSAEAEKSRAQVAPGAIVTPSANFYQMFEDRKRIVIDHVEQLRLGLGDSSFKKLEAYILATNPAPANVAKPTSAASTTPAAKEQKKGR